MQQLALALPYPPGWCDKHKFRPEAWPQWIQDRAGRRWLVLHVGGSPYANSKPAQFCCHQPPGVAYHHIKDIEAFHA